MEILSGSLIYNIVKDIAKFRGQYLTTDEKTTTSTLEDHIKWAEGWSRHIQMFGMTKAVPVEQKSITLSISDRPRKFSSPTKHIDKKDILSEADVLSNSANYVILGDPGCGKTTLCKRLTRTLILSEPNEPLEVLDAPLVVLGRDLHSDFQLTAKLAEIFGIKFKPFNENKHREEMHSISDREEYNRRMRSLRSSWMENVHSEAKELLMKALSNGGFALIIDGIDEINSNYRVAFEHDLQDYINRCPQLKVTCTCRAGDWTRSVTTADLLAIEPLNEAELQEIVGAWADKPADFLEAIENVPYKEVLDRPLFLTLLLIIFNQGYELPDCPVDVYERITSLLIERWDRERDIHRESKFASFLSEKKLRFLSVVAYNLTFEYNQKRFSANDLHNLYVNLAGRFKLPINEFEEVLKETESHTGIIVESGFNHFEFCHLTVQEFLAAKHLVGLASSKNILTLLDESPATVAVATSVSAEPSNFFANLLDEFCSVQERGLRRNQISGLDSFITYCSRLRLELPEFTQNNRLAVCIIRLWIICSQLEIAGYHNAGDLRSSAIALSRFEAVRSSVNMLLERPGVLGRTSSPEEVSVRTMGTDYRFPKSFLTAMG